MLFHNKFINAYSPIISASEGGIISVWYCKEKQTCCSFNI